MSTKPEGRFPLGALRPPLPSAPPCKRVPPGAWHAAGAAARATPRVQQPRLFASVRLWSVAWRKMASPLARKGFMDTRCLQIALRNHCQHRRRSPPWAGFRLRTPPLARFARNLIRSYPRAAVPARNPRMWEFRRRGGAGGAAKSAVLLPPRLVLDAAVLCGLRRSLTLPALRTPRAESTCQLFSVLKSEPPRRILTSHLV